MMRKLIMISVLFFLVTATAVPAADYGIFKSRWNKIPVNRVVPARERYRKPDGEWAYRSAAVYVRSISLKCINSKLSSDWKEAFRGLRTYYCAVKIDVDISKLEPGHTYEIDPDFYDADGIRIFVYEPPLFDGLSFSLPREIDKTKSVGVDSSLSHREPVSIRFE